MVSELTNCVILVTANKRGVFQRTYTLYIGISMVCNLENSAQKWQDFNLSGMLTLPTHKQVQLFPFASACVRILTKPYKLLTECLSV